MNPILRGIASDFKPIRGNMKPPRKARLTGEVDEATKSPIYRIPKKVWGRRPVRNPDGEVEYHVAGDGRRLRPKYERYVVTTIEEEFILDDAGNGMVRKNRRFREGPEELAAKSRREEESAALREVAELARVLRSNGITPADLARVVRNGQASAEEEETLPLPPFEPPAGQPGDDTEERMARVRAAVGDERA